MKRLGFSKRGAVLALSFLVLSIAFSTLVPFGIVRGEGENWLTGWSDRERHVVTSASGAGTNYQVSFTIHYSSGTNSGADVYVGGGCQDDFDDIRFTASDGDTLYDCFMAYKTDSDFAVFWVEITDDLSTEDVVMYIYWGNAGASSVSNGPNTFAKYHGYASSAFHDANSALGTQFRYMSRVTYGVDNVNIVWGVCDALGTIHDSIQIQFYPVTGPFNRLLARKDSAVSYDNAVPFTVKDTYYVIEFVYNTTSVRGFVDGVERWDPITTNLPTADMGLALIYANSANSQDWSFISKYIDPEPQHGAYGEVIADTYTLNYGAVSNNSTMIGTNTTLTTSWGSNGTLSGGGYVFGWNMTETFVNDTWTSFGGATSPQWSNVTESLGDDLGLYGAVVWWQIWANNTADDWNTTGPQYFTLSAVVVTYTIYPSGTLTVNGTETGNGTAVYLPGSTLSFLAGPAFDYVFSGYVWGGEVANDNPLNVSLVPPSYVVDYETSLVATFSESGEGDPAVGLAYMIIAGLFVAFLVGCVAFILVSGRNG